MKGTDAYRAFEQLNADRQKEILNAAMAVFAEKSYGQASTNDIVKRAGISKGILFHYFRSKKRLFLYLFSWSLDYFMERFNREVDLGERDVISRIWSVVEFKMDVSRDYPMMFDFFQQVFVDTPQDILSEIMKTRDLLALDVYTAIFQDIDWSLFREELRDEDSRQRSLDAIRWIIEGYGNKLIAEIRSSGGKLDIEAAFARSSDFFLFVRKLFYKNAEYANP